MSRRTPLIGVLPSTGGRMDHVRVLGYLDGARDLALARFSVIDPKGFLAGRDTSGYDAVVLRSGQLKDPAVRQVIDELFMRRVRLVLDLDEDPWAPPGHTGVPSVADGRVSRTLRRSLRQFSAGLVASESLASGWGPACGSMPIHVVANRLNLDVWRAPSQVRGAVAPADIPRPLVLSTGGELAELEPIRELPALLSQHFDAEVVVDVVGISSPLLPEGFRNVTPPSLRYRALGKWMAGQATRWSVGLVPATARSAADTSSEVVVLEHAALGIPVVVSNELDAPSLHAGAVVAGDEPGDWIAPVVAMHMDAGNARALGSVALNDRCLDPKAVAEWIALVSGVPTAPSDAPVAQERPVRVAVMSHGCGGATAPAIVRATIERSAAAVDRMILVADAGDAKALSPLPANVTVLAPPRRGGVFYAYKAGVEAARRQGEVDQLLLIDDSFIGPIVPVADILDFAARSGLDVMGLTRSDVLEAHAEPYFLVVQQRALAAAEFREFWEDMMPVANAPVAYAMYAIGFSRAMKNAGLSVGSYFEPTDDERELAGSRAALDPLGVPWGAGPTTMLADRILVQQRLPILSLRIVRDYFELGGRELLELCAAELPEFADVPAALERAGLVPASVESGGTTRAVSLGYGTDRAFS